MNPHFLFAKFTRGLNWNALLYIVYKFLFTLLSFLLFNILTTKDFSCWSTVNSTIFLLLLWLDFGFRKSVPRYSPEFNKNNKLNKKFIIFIILFHLMVLISSIPLLQFFLKKAFQMVNVYKTEYLILGTILFITEGMGAILRLVFHSYFLHKQFNATTIIVMIIEMTSNLVFIYFMNKSTILLTVIFINRIIANTIIILISSIMLTSSTSLLSYESKKINICKTTKKFIKHSTYMWVNNNLKSLSERNFLMLFITYKLGPHLANSFKIANDAALLFYRIVVKTIGSTDTLLLAHIATLNQKRLMRFAFTKLITRVAGLCLPLLGLVLFCFFQGNTTIRDPFVFYLFIIMAVGHLIETMLLPFERILEVHNTYRCLILSYIPYFFIPASIFLGFNMPSAGLLGSVIAIHVVRLVSLGLIVFFAYKYHRHFVFNSLSLFIKPIFSFFRFFHAFFRIFRFTSVFPRALKKKNVETFY